MSWQLTEADVSIIQMKNAQPAARADLLMLSAQRQPRWAKGKIMKSKSFAALVLAVVFSMISAPGSARTESDLHPADYKQRTPPFTLDKHIEAKIINKKNQRIVGIRSASFASNHNEFPPDGVQHGFDLLDIQVSIAGDFEFEGVWHGRLLIRKLVSQPDWTNCEVFYVTDDTPLIRLSRMSKEEMGKHLKLQ
jgi:hypothetical protein